MATSLVDSPPAPGEQQAPGAPDSATNGVANGAANGAGPHAQAAAGVHGSAPAAAPPAPPERACAECGAAMATSQDWCLQCGAGAPGSIGSPGWRSAATILAATALLALGAAAAGYAALTKKSTPAAVVIARTAPPAATTPAAPTAPVTPGTPTTIAPLPPTPTVKPPKIPLTVKTPTVAPTFTPIKPTTTPAGTTSTPTTTATGGAGATEPTAILLDTNAASTYNPYGYPAGEFGDPSLAIDGDTSTGWTAQVQPTMAPKLAEGVLLDLKSRMKLGSAKLTTASPGMTVQLYGANTQTAPASITDPAWVPLSHSQLVHKRHVLIKLLQPKQAFRFITLWISRAPASSTAQAPGHVSVNELELFPPS